MKRSTLATFIAALCLLTVGVSQLATAYTGISLRSYVRPNIQFKIVAQKYNYKFNWSLNQEPAETKPEPPEATCPFGIGTINGSDLDDGGFDPLQPLKWFLVGATKAGSTIVFNDLPLNVGVAPCKDFWYDPDSGLYGEMGKPTKWAIRSLDRLPMGIPSGKLSFIEQELRGGWANITLNGTANAPILSPAVQGTPGTTVSLSDLTINGRRLWNREYEFLLWLFDLYDQSYAAPFDLPIDFSGDLDLDGYGLLTGVLTLGINIPVSVPVEVPNGVTVTFPNNGPFYDGDDPMNDTVPAGTIPVGTDFDISANLVDFVTWRLNSVNSGSVLDFSYVARITTDGNGCTIITWEEYSGHNPRTLDAGNCNTGISPVDALNNLNGP